MIRKISAAYIDPEDLPDSCASERALLRATFERALRDVFRIKGIRPPEHERTERRDAIKWFGLNRPYIETEAAPFSFEWVCWHLKLDAALIHRNLTAILADQNKYWSTKRKISFGVFKVDARRYTMKKTRKLTRLAA